MPHRHSVHHAGIGVVGGKLPVEMVATRPVSVVRRILAENCERCEPYRCLAKVRCSHSDTLHLADAVYPARKWQISTIMARRTAIATFHARISASLKTQTTTLADLREIVHDTSEQQCGPSRRENGCGNSDWRDLRGIGKLLVGCSRPGRS